MKRIARAHDSGFALPVRIFLVAERRKFGWLRERFVISEFIDGKGLAPTSDSPFPKPTDEILEAVKTAHRFGITWGGDPNPINFLRRQDGALRGIDLSYKRATWKLRGKDFLRLEQVHGVSFANAGFRARALKAVTRFFCRIERNENFR